MNIWVGTTNKGKLSEYKLLIDKFLPGFQTYSLQDLPHYSQPPENGASFLENARIKAKSLKVMKAKEWVFAEDSGLEVLGLNNLPGIHSARYAGPKAADSENNAKLLKMLQLRSPSQREARFVCVTIAFNPAGEELVLEGELKGSIASSAQGTAGFGYDPVFIPAGETQTLAQLGASYKIKNSHRTQAFEKLVQKILATSN